MSKIGQVNLGLQEQAEELGFETVQEAMDNGYKAILKSDGTAVLAADLEKELITAHQDYEHRKRLIIDKLEMLIADTPYQVYKETLREAINFINEKEI